MKKLLIMGEWCDSGSDECIEVINPATEAFLNSVPAGMPQDVERAVAAAKAAFPGWGQVPAVERASLMHTAAANMRTHFDELAQLLTLEEGKPLPENEEEIDWSINTLDYYAELGRHIRGRVLPSPDVGQLSLVLKEPFGVVACIVPWNYPILLLVWKIAPALAAGNTVVIKPPSQAPLTVLRMLEVAFDHFPAGVINAVTGRGQDIGDVLVRHPDVPVVAFTGSTAVGRRIAQLTAGQMKHLHLELGGKDPFVIADDAPMDEAVEALAYAALINTGQVCTSTERVYAPQDKLAELSELLADRVSKLRLGPGLEPTTDMGPMIGDSGRALVESHIAEAVARGARVLTGGRRPPDS
ncbi:MAG: aldehyde dehydrogenase, partial [Anaerolineales bacterium]|nr:aldehyde dehydrogenase [Anaerolineales bacterium]